MLIRIEGTELPGLRCAPADAPQAYDNVHVGPQRGKEATELVRGDAERATWTFEVIAKDNGDLGGDFVQGKKGDRFFYLCWGVVEPKLKFFHMFRRAKLMVNDIPPKVLAAARANKDGKTVLVGRLGLTDAKGLPLCARVKPPAIAWSIEKA